MIQGVNLFLKEVNNNCIFEWKSRYFMKHFKKAYILIVIIISAMILPACKATFLGGDENLNIKATYGLPDQNLQSYDFTYGYSDLKQPFVTENLPDRSLYPMLFIKYGIGAIGVGEELYFTNDESLYYTYKDGDEWKVENTGITHVKGIVVADQTVFCYIENNVVMKVVLYDTEQKMQKQEINLVEDVSDGANRFYELNCTGNGKAYLTARRLGPSADDKQSDDNLIISIDHSANLNVVANFTADEIVVPTYADENYLVYAKRNISATVYGMYVMNQRTGSVNQISDLATINADDRDAPFFYWNGKFVFMVNDHGICVINQDGSDAIFYKGPTDYGFTLVGDKLYFPDYKLFSFDLRTQQQQVYDYGDKSDFLGEITQFGKYIVLKRCEGNSATGIIKHYTIHMITLPE